MKSEPTTLLKTIAFCVLLTLVWTFVNLTCFLHTHIDFNGNLVTHAHPFSRRSEGEGAAAHAHSRSEFVLLALVYEALKLTAVFILLLFFMPRYPRQESVSFDLIPIITHTVYGNRSKRGPPAIGCFA